MSVSEPQSVWGAALHHVLCPSSPLPWGCLFRSDSQGVSQDLCQRLLGMLRPIFSRGCWAAVLKETHCCQPHGTARDEADTNCCSWFVRRVAGAGSSPAPWPHAPGAPAHCPRPQCRVQERDGAPHACATGAGALVPPLQGTGRLGLLSAARSDWLVRVSCQMLPGSCSAHQAQRISGKVPQPQCSPVQSILCPSGAPRYGREGLGS